jgi:hypothetical protein
MYCDEVCPSTPVYEYLTFVLFTFASMEIKFLENRMCPNMWVEATMHVLLIKVKFEGLRNRL